MKCITISKYQNVPTGCPHRFLWGNRTSSVELSRHNCLTCGRQVKCSNFLNCENVGKCSLEILLPLYKKIEEPTYFTTIPCMIDHPLRIVCWIAYLSLRYVFLIFCRWWGIVCRVAAVVCGWECFYPFLFVFGGMVLGPPFLVFFFFLLFFLLLFVSFVSSLLLVGWSVAWFFGGFTRRGSAHLLPPCPAVAVLLGRRFVFVVVSSCSHHPPPLIHSNMDFSCSIWKKKKGFSCVCVCKVVIVARILFSAWPRLQFRQCPCRGKCLRPWW